MNFGDVAVYPRTRELRIDGKLVDLSSRAFEILLVLMEADGAIVEKKELLRRVWPHTIVSDAGVKVQVYHLRRALGRDGAFIKTIPNRGYMLTAPLAITSASLHVERELPAETRGTEHSPAIQQQKESAATVIVIDDDKHVRDALEGLLRSVGMNVEKFSTIREYEELKRDSPPACIVLDVMLPGRTGLEFFSDRSTQAIRAAPVIFISGYADVPMSVRAMKAGAFEFLTKPIRHVELLEAVRRAVES